MSGDPAPPAGHQAGPPAYGFILLLPSRNEALRLQRALASSG